jgi:hypothetical protein
MNIVIKILNHLLCYYYDKDEILGKEKFQEYIIINVNN